MRKLWLVLLLLASGAAHAASFDCAKAKTPEEKAICASPELSAADEKMAAAYKAVLAAATPEIVDEVRDAQRAWLRAIADHCVIPRSPSSTALPECLLGYYQTRTAELQRLTGTNHDAFITQFIYLTWPDAPGESSDLEENPGFGTLKATWPESTNDTPEWKAWNKAIEAATQSLASLDGEKSPSGEWLKKWAADGEFEVEASVGLFSGELVTASINIEGMGHGAGHPGGTSIEFNWLLKQKRELRPDDVFRKNSGWEKTIEELCSNELQRPDASPDDYWEKALPKVVLDSRNWQIDGKGLTIYFPEYTVSRGVYPAGPIPWTTLKPFLQPSFTIPK